MFKVYRRLGVPAFEEALACGNLNFVLGGARTLRRLSGGEGIARQFSIFPKSHCSLDELKTG